MICKNFIYIWMKIKTETIEIYHYNFGVIGLIKLDL